MSAAPRPVMRLVGRAEAWLTGEKHSLHGTAVTRMVLGFVVWSQLVVNWSDRHYTWGVGARWTAPIRDESSWPWFLRGLTDLPAPAFDALYLLLMVLGVLMMLGVRTRVVTILVLGLWMSLYVTNPFVGSGGDAVQRMVLLYLCFTDSGRVWSYDAWRAGRRDRPAAGLLPSWLTAAAHNLALVLIVHQVVVVYVASAFWKLQGPRWLDGTAVYYPLQTEAYSPWGDLLHPVSGFGPLVLVATWSALVIQLFFPVLLLYRSTRFVALVVVTGMHLGIGLLLGIMYFSLVMIAVDMILVSDRSWLEAWRRVREIAPLTRVTHASARGAEKDSERS